ncbi:MAG: class I SAM-dependent methyltransferase, partial [Flavobacteriaceae bacterium]|nr:class I SAM-dependent methyltransferase [Flavobacteriaceae bacterium]
YDEASAFMKRLTDFLKLPKNSKILDLACGKGRHSRYLNQLGYDVVGADLSPSSIEYASQFENEKLHFAVHDMCIPFPKKFDAIFNLFTSFGYFEKDEDNLRTIKAIAAQLKENGAGVIDFLNMEYTKNTLVPSETKVVDGIEFNLSRYFENGYLWKEIEFDFEGENHYYTERVKALTLDDFKGYFDAAGVSIRHCFGDYKLTSFDPATSPRLILIFS